MEIKKVVQGVTAGKEALKKWGRPKGTKKENKLFPKKWVIGLTIEQHNEFSKKAKIQGRTNAEFCREAMRNYI